MKLVRNDNGSFENVDDDGPYIFGEATADYITIDGNIDLAELKTLIAFIETSQPSPVATRAETEAAPELVAEAQGHSSLCLMCGQNRIVV